MTNVIVYSLEAEHDRDVKESFLRGYSTNNARYSGNLDIIPFGNLDSALSFASTNNYQFVIYSIANTDGLTGIANNYYPNVLTFLPAGNNNHELVFTQSILDNHVSSVITGCVNDKGLNKTGYNVEFIDIDPITSNNFSSYSNGYIAGKLAYIKDWYKCSDWEARHIARQTATLKNDFTDENGFGVINVNDAINTYIEIPQDPILNLNSIGNISVTRNKNQININIDALENASNYKIYRNDELIYNGANNSYTDTINPTGDFFYKYKAYNSKQETEFSQSQKIVYRAYTSILYQ